MESYRRNTVLLLLVACVLHLAGAPAPAAPGFSLEQTIGMLKDKLKQCVLNSENGENKFGFKEMFKYKTPEVYTSYVLPTARKDSPIVKSSGELNLCFRKSSFDVLVKSQETFDVRSRIIDLKEQHIHVFGVQEDLVKAARAHSIPGTTFSELENGLDKFNFKDTDFFDVEVTNTGDTFGVSVFLRAEDAGFLRIMYAEMMANDCVMDFVRHTVVHSFICDPIFDLVLSPGFTQLGLPILSLIIDFIPERDSHLAHLVTLGVCLSTSAAAKLKKYNFLDKTKHNFRVIADALGKIGETISSAAKPAAKYLMISSMWDRISQVNLPGWDNVRQKFQDKDFGVKANFWKNLSDVTDLLRWLQGIPGAEFASSDTFGNIIAISTGATDAKEHDHEHGIIKEVTKEQASKMKDIFLKGKDLLVKGARLKDDMCEYMWGKMVELKDGFWKLSVTKLMEGNKKLQEQIKAFKEK